MPIGSLVLAALMAFVLLVPTLMVAVLISGLARRGPGRSDLPARRMAGERQPLTGASR